jgi:dihydrodipicolinate synthase/N-acetylneuraminate lyase
MRGTPVRALTAVLLAALAVTACGGSPASVTPATASCRHLFEAWLHSAPTVALKADLRAVNAQVRPRNFPGLKAALERLGSAAARLPRSPHCADPAGYYRQLLAIYTAAGNDARSASGIASLVTELRLVTSPAVKIESKLAVELNRTVGKNY